MSFTAPKELGKLNLAKQNLGNRRRVDILDKAMQLALLRIGATSARAAASSKRRAIHA
jgi:hypothetical protein